MHSNDSAQPNLPPGFISVKKGGRPKNEARDAAVFMAKLWRMERHGDSATAAERWIVDAWEKMGKEASKGIGEPAHVRTAIKRAKDRGLGASLLSAISDSVSPDGDVWVAAECKRDQGGAILKNGARCWIWCPGMTKADEAKVKNVNSQVRLGYSSGQDVFLLTPVADAVVALMNGKS